MMLQARIDEETTSLLFRIVPVLVHARVRRVEWLITRLEANIVIASRLNGELPAAGEIPEHARERGERLARVRDGVEARRRGRFALRLRGVRRVRRVLHD